MEAGRRARVRLLVLWEQKTLDLFNISTIIEI
jgi:hypothetical protein